MVLGELGSNMQNETGPISYTIYKNKLKMNERPKREAGNIKTTLNHNLTPARVAKINNLGKNRCW